jgi:hypothetical protein
MSRTQVPFRVAFLAVLGIITFGYGTALVAAQASRSPALWWPASIPDKKLLGVSIGIYGVVWMAVSLVQLLPLVTRQTRIPFLASIVLAIFWGYLAVWWALSHPYQPGAWGVPSIYIGAALLIWVTAVWGGDRRDG